MKNTWKLFYLIFLSLFMLAACSRTPSYPAAPTLSGTGIPTPAPSYTLNTASYNTGSDVISPQDLLEINVFKVPDLSKTVRVDDGGNITLPLLGVIRASGMSAIQLEKTIASRLERDYMYNPQVNVFVKESTHSRITVEGAVNRPGVFPVAGDMTFLQAIAMAGGLNPVADKNNAVLFRRNGAGISRYRVNLSAIRTGAAADPPLKSDDRIVVQESSGKVLLNNMRGFVSPLTVF